jgi:tetratricopeptide (TPR) repeat protein
MNRIVLLKEMIQKNPDDIFLHYAMAMEFMSLDDFVNAINKFDEIKSIDLNYLPTYYQLGKCYESIHHNQLAIDSYQKGIEIAISQKDLKTANELRTALEEIE